MTEPMANVGSEQEMSELPENKESEAKVEGGNLQTSFEENHADKQISQLPVEAGLTGNSEFVEASAEQNLFERSDKADDMPSERQMDGTPLEKETDDTLLEKQTDDQVTMPITGNSESVDAAAEHNLAEKSDKDADMPLKKQTDGTPLEKGTDDTPLEKGTDDTPLEKQTDDRVTVPVTVPLTGNSESVDTSAEHNLAEKSDKAGDTSLEKQTDGTPLEKETNDTPLDKQTDDQVTVPVTGNSKSVEASADHNLAEKSDKDDDAPLEKQTNGTTLENQVDDHVTVPMIQMEPGSDQRGASDVKTAEVNEAVATPLENKTGSAATDTEGSHPEDNHSKTPLKEEKTGGEHSTPMEGSNQSYTFEPYLDGDDSGSEEEQAAFMKELENFYRERNMDFKQPKFYGEPLNCLKLWRAVTRLGGYEQVTACKLWRQVGESFKPPKTCTTVSWSFRIFFEKALLEYEKHKIQTGELKSSMVNLPEFMSVDNQVGGNQASGSGRARRDAAARAMQVWHTQRLLGTGEVGDPKDKTSLSYLGKDKQFKSFGTLKKRKPSNLEHSTKVAKTDPVNPQGDIMVADVGIPADWVKINVRRTNEFFEVYALVPGLLREEVQVQSDPAGRLIISGDPEHPDNPWGVTPFKKVITLPSRIDPHQTSAVVTLHGQLFVRAPIDQSDG